MRMRRVKIIFVLALAGAGPSCRDGGPLRLEEPPRSPAPAKRPTDLYGDPLPPGAVARCGTTRFRADGNSHGIAYSPDGKVIATGHHGGRLRVWDAESGRLLRGLERGTGLFHHVAFSPDSRALAAASREERGLWELATGRAVAKLEGSGEPGVSLAFSPDGKRLAVARRDGTVALLDRDTGETVRSIAAHGGAAYAVAFSPDGRLLATGGRDKKVRVWRVSTGEKTLEFEGHEAGVNSVRFSPDGRTLASSATVALPIESDGLPEWGMQVVLGDGEEYGPVVTGQWHRGDSSIRLWDVAAGSKLPRATGRHGSGVMPMAFSPDGRFVASVGHDKSIRLWETVSGNDALVMANSIQVNGLAFSTDGRFVAGAMNRTAISLWDARTGKNCTTPQGHVNRVTRVAFSPDGKRVASSGGGTVRVWESLSGRQLLQLLGGGTALRFSNDGKTLTRCGKKTTVWDGVTGHQLLEYPKMRDEPPHCAMSPDGSIAAELDSEGVSFRDLRTGREISRLKGHAHTFASSLAFSPDGSMLAAEGKSGQLRIWDVVNGSEIHSFWAIYPTGDRSTKTDCLAFSPDGMILASGHWRTVQLWNVGDWGKLRDLTGHDRSVNAAAFSPDGGLLATGEYRAVRLWDVSTGTELLKVDAHGEDVHSLAFSPDGRYLATGSADTTVLVWDLDLVKEMKQAPEAPCDTREGTR